MGVPKFFAWVVRNYPRIIQRRRIDAPEVLLLDWNCGIHPCCYRVLAEVEAQGQALTDAELEERMVQEVLAYLDYVVGYCGPTRCVYVAIDGWRRGPR